MIDAVVGVPFEAIANGAEPDLVGTITVEVYDPSDGSIVLAPTTAGITEPRPGTYRALLTVEDAGTYAIRWAYDTSSAEELLTVYTYATASDPTIKPTVADVALLMRARTTVNGNEVGTFNTSTRPTASEVGAIIDRCADDVVSRLGYIPDTHISQARWIITLLSAAHVELSYQPALANDENSAYSSLIARYEEALAGYRITRATTLA